MIASQLTKNDFNDSCELYQVASELCKLYSIGDVVTNPEKISGGMLHDMWCLRATSGHYALKKINESNVFLLANTLLAIDKAETLALHYQQRGLPTRVALKSSSLKWVERCQQGNQWMIFPWIEGRILFNENITENKARRGGALLAMIQQSGPALSNVKPPTWCGYNEEHWSHLVKKAGEQELSWAATALDCKHLLNYWSHKAAAASALLNTQLIVSHRDLSASNIIWQYDEHPVVIDWEYAGLVNSESECFNTAMTWSYRGQGNFDSAIFDSLIAGTEMNFTHDRATLLAGYAGYLLEWCEFNMQRSLRDKNRDYLGGSEVMSIIILLDRILR